MASSSVSVWSLGNPQKLLTTNQFLASTIFFTNMNISFFSLRFDLFSIIAKEVNQIRKNEDCVVARLVFVFCCALTTWRCNAFQHIFEIKRNRSFTAHISRLSYFLWLCPNQRNTNGVIIWEHDVIFWIFDDFVFLFSSLDIGPSFLSISFLALELWQFLFVRDLTRTPVIEKNPVWIPPNIGRLEQVKIWQILHGCLVRLVSRCYKAVNLPPLMFRRYLGIICSGESKFTLPPN